VAIGDASNKRNWRNGSSWKKRREIELKDGGGQTGSAGAAKIGIGKNRMVERTLSNELLTLRLLSAFVVASFHRTD